MSMAMEGKKLLGDSPCPPHWIQMRPPGDGIQQVEGRWRRQVAGKTVTIKNIPEEIIKGKSQMCSQPAHQEAPALFVITS